MSQGRGSWEEASLAMGYVGGLWWDGCLRTGSFGRVHWVWSLGYHRWMNPWFVQGTAFHVGHPGVRTLPADVVFPAGVQRRQAVGLLLGLVGAGRNDGLPPAFGTGCVVAGAEEELVGVFGWHAVEELAQGLVALGAVAGVGPGQASDAEGDVLRPQPLAHLVHVAGFGSVQTPVHLGHLVLGPCGVVGDGDGALP